MAQNNRGRPTVAKRGFVNRVLTPEEIKAIVAQSQKRSAVYDLITNPTNVTVEVN